MRIRDMLIGLILAATISSPLAAGKQAVVRCDRVPGADAGAELSSCIARLPGASGVANASRFTGHQTISADVFSATKKTVRLLLSAATVSIDSNVTIPSTVALVLSDRASLASSAGKTITIRGAIEAPGNVPIAVETLRAAAPHWSCSTSGDQARAPGTYRTGSPNPDSELPHQKQVTAGGGILAQSAADVRIHGNALGNGPLPAIRLSGPRDVDIVGNTLPDGASS